MTTPIDEDFGEGSKPPSCSLHSKCQNPLPSLAVYILVSHSECPCSYLTCISKPSYVAISLAFVFCLFWHCQFWSETIGKFSTSFWWFDACRVIQYAFDPSGLCLPRVSRERRVWGLEWKVVQGRLSYFISHSYSLHSCNVECSWITPQLDSMQILFMWRVVLKSTF